MPLYVLNRNYTLSTTAGHRITFVKDKPVYVPPTILKEAVAIGATPADGSDPDPGIVEEMKKEEDALTPEERITAIVAAIRTLVRRNQREDFNAANQPKEQPLSEITGFKVDTKERNAALQRYYDIEFGLQ